MSDRLCELDEFNFQTPNEQPALHEKPSTLEF